MSRNCSTPASTSGPRSTSSISKASPTWSATSPASPCARPCRTACCKRADDVVLVDITPDELIQRLHEGKVYLPRDGAPRDAEFLHARAISPPCANSPCAAPPTASTTRWSIICARTPSKDRGRRPTICWSASAADAQAEIRGAHRRAVWRRGSTPPGSSSMSRRKATRRRTPRRCGCVDDAFRLAERLGAETSAAERRRHGRARSCVTRGAKTSPRSWSAARAPASGGA